MNSYRRNESGGRRLFFTTIVVLLILALDTLSGGSLRALVRSAAITVHNEGTNVFSAILGSGLFSSRHALFAENEALKRRVAELEMRTAGYEVIREENVSLREVAGLGRGTEGIAAPIVSSVRSSPYGTFIIGAGRGEGVELHDLVLAGDREGGSFVVGVIGEVEAHSSLALEIFAPGTSIEGTVREIPVAVEGSGAGRARTRVPLPITIGVGDPVFSPQFRARAIGVVGALRESTAHTHRDVFIEIPVPLSALQYVYVISPSR